MFSQAGLVSEDPARKVGRVCACSEVAESCGELELELIQTQMTQKPMLRVEVGARALRNQTGRGGFCVIWDLGLY